MDQKAKKDVQKYVLAVIKSLGQNISHELEHSVLKMDPTMTIRQLVRLIKKLAGISPNQSLFLYAYGSILNGNDSVKEVEDRYKHKLGKKGLELFYSQMAAFGYEQNDGEA